MKRSLIFAALLTLVMAATALPSDAVLSGPAIQGVMNGCLQFLGIGFDGDETLDGVVGYGAGNGPRSVYHGGDLDAATGYGAGTGPRAVYEGETDGAVDYGVGTGPRRPADGDTDGVVGYGVGSGPRSPHGG